MSPGYVQCDDERTMLGCGTENDCVRTTDRVTAVGNAGDDVGHRPFGHALTVSETVDFGRVGEGLSTLTTGGGVMSTAA